jgi:hypothetical protein
MGMGRYVMDAVVIDLDGQLIRELTLDSNRDYQPLAHA